LGAEPALRCRSHGGGQALLAGCEAGFRRTVQMPPLRSRLRSSPGPVPPHRLAVTGELARAKGAECFPQNAIPPRLNTQARGPVQKLEFNDLAATHLRKAAAVEAAEAAEAETKAVARAAAEAKAHAAADALLAEEEALAERKAAAAKRAGKAASKGSKGSKGKSKGKSSGKQ